MNFLKYFYPSILNETFWNDLKAENQECDIQQNRETTEEVISQHNQTRNNICMHGKNIILRLWSNNIHEFQNCTSVLEKRLIFVTFTRLKKNHVKENAATLKFSKIYLS